jgi:hypothetical protein
MRRGMRHPLLQTALFWAQSALSVSARAAHWEGSGLYTAGT